MPVRLPVQIHRTAQANVRVRLRKGTVTDLTPGNTCAIVLADGVTKVGGVVAVTGYSPQVGDIVIVERVSAVTYALGAITPP